MTDKNREAFEQWAASEGYLVQKITRPYYGEVYKAESTHRAWKGWQASRDHFATKLSEKAMVDVVVEALKGYVLPIRSPIAAKVITKALRAAGVRWKEEA